MEDEGRTQSAEEIVTTQTEQQPPTENPPTSPPSPPVEVSTVAPLPEEPPQKKNPPSDVFSVRLPSEAVPIVEALIKYHFVSGNIGAPSRALYLKYLITEDAERTRADIKKRRAAIMQ